MQDADGDTRMKSSLSSSHSRLYPPPTTHSTASNLPPLSNRHQEPFNEKKSAAFASSAASSSSSSSANPFPAHSNGPALFAAQDGGGQSSAGRDFHQDKSPGLGYGIATVTPDQDASKTVDAVTSKTNTASLPAAQPTVYLATYSNVPVFEITVRGIAVMRRRADGYLNATQILKVAGVEKAKRTKILEKEILTGEHEKVQGGYGKYQGTWIPLTRAQELAATYNVAHLLRAVLEFDPRTADSVPTAGPKKRPNPNAPANSSLFKGFNAPVASSKTSAGGNAHHTPRAASPASHTCDSATPIKGPSQQPRFLQLRAPPGSSEQNSSSLWTEPVSAQNHLPPGSVNLISALGASTGGCSNRAADGIPPGSSTSMREALSGYSQYGYTPQGVPLPTPTKSKRTEPDAATPDSVEQPSKRLRTSDAPPSGQAAATSSSTFAIGPSPVKDLAALAGPDSSLRGASHPRLHRVPLGPPDELVGKAGNARFADRPQIPRTQDEGEKRMRDRLVALFMQEDGGRQPADDHGSGQGDWAAKLDQLLMELRAAISLGGAVVTADDGGPVPCIDAVIDDHGHAALHWASALCRLGLVKTLVAKETLAGGANLHAGNHAGETALHRSVLVTNAYDASLFPELLELLAPSLHTRDFKSRTVLHHIALVAGLKGRATPARYYLACLLEYIEQREGGRFAPLVDAQDEDGETALGIAARQGNNSMVKMLLEVGARKDLPNCFGLKASDWGIDTGTAACTEDQLTPQTKAGLKEGRGDVVTALMRPPKGPVQKSQDVLDQLRSILDELSSTSDRELTEKTNALQTAQSHLQSATRELTSRRRMIAGSQSRVAELEERKIRISNLRRSLAKISNLIEDGEGPASISDAQVQNLVDLHTAGQGKTQAEEERFLSALVSPNPSDSDALVLNRWLVKWYAKRNIQLESDTMALASEAKTTEAQCRRVVAMYSKIEESKVEGILEELVSAIESYSEVDLARVASFLAKTVAGRGSSLSAGGSISAIGSTANDLETPVAATEATETAGASSGEQTAADVAAAPAASIVPENSI